MTSKSSIPKFGISKSINGGASFSFSLLENSYTNYDSSNAHRHDYYEFIFFQQSGGFHEIDFYKYNIEKNSLHLLSPGQVHLLRRDKNVSGNVISFSHDFLISFIPFAMLHSSYGFLMRRYTSPIISFSDSEFQKLSVLFTMWHQSDHTNQRLMGAYLHLLLEQISSADKSQSKVSKETRFTTEKAESLETLVEANYKMHYPVDFYANSLSVSKDYLNEISNSVFGCSVGNFISRRLVLEAKRLLYHSTLSVKEIANELQFSDASYFAKFFKKQTLNTPHEFRRSIREKYH